MDRRTSALALAPAPTPRRDDTLGDRVRFLRKTRGLTQTELAASRFSKEYISQIECGKTRPTAETVAWLADQLGVDPRYLEAGVSSVEHERLEEAIVRAEAAVDEKRYDDAIAIVAEARPRSDAPDLELRALLADGWARMYVGDLPGALGALQRARSIAEADRFDDADRADCLYRLGCVRYHLSSISTAIGLYNEALTLAERSEKPCDRLRAHILEWRSRCYRRERDFEAAREDVERALELAENLNDDESAAHVYFQASLVDERDGNWIRARAHAERARQLYEAVDDQVNAGRLLNNLGGLNFLLGHTDEAIAHLKDAYRVALELELDEHAAQAVSSLSQVHLRTGELELAEQQARYALELLADRVDFAYEIGNAQLVLGRSLLGQGRLDEAERALAEAERTLTSLSSASHGAAAWTAQGDLAAKRGDDEAAALLYRRAAEALQDVRF